MADASCVGHKWRKFHKLHGVKLSQLSQFLQSAIAAIAANRTLGQEAGTLLHPTAKLLQEAANYC